MDWTNWTHLRIWSNGEEMVYSLDATTGILTLVEPAAPPAPLHPLQRMSSQPSAFGQSMWRPWE